MDHRNTMIQHFDDPARRPVSTSPLEHPQHARFGKPYKKVIVPKLLASLNQAECMFNGSSFTKHCAHTTVFFFGQVNRTSHSFCLKSTASENVLNMDFHKWLRIVFSAFSINLHFISRHLLALFAQNSNDIHTSTACQCYQQHFHRTWTCILSTIVFSSVKYYVMA